MFVEHLRAGFPALWVQTLEPARTMAEYGEAARGIGYKTFSWDCQSGIRDLAEGSGYANADVDALGAITQLDGQNGRSALFLQHYHKFMRGEGSTEIIQGICNVVNRYKAQGKTLAVLAPNTDIPIELEKIFTALRFDLPAREDLLKTLHYMAESSKRPLPDDATQEKVIDAGLGLTSWEFENALALSLICSKKFDPAIVMEQKKQLIKKNAGLMLEDTDETLDNLGGMENLKEFCLKVASSKLAKGVLILGTPGTGKSHFSKALGKSLGIPTAALDFGRMFGSLVGESEERIRTALDVIDAFSPCVLRIDEIEKGLSGIKSSGSTDGGTGSRVFGTFLNWLQDHKTRVFVIATCNDIQQMPPEFLRAERWDAIFFVDLPTPPERQIILNIYRKLYEMKGEPANMDGWSGAEIKSVCRIAKMMETSIKDAERYVMPLSRSMAEHIQKLRDWASTRTIPASKAARPEKITGRRIE